MQPLPPCSVASRAADNDPAGSSSAFRSFLLITDTGSWSSKAADRAADERLDPLTAAWVSSNRVGLRPFAVRPVAGRRADTVLPFLAGRVGPDDALRRFDGVPQVTDLEGLTTGRPVGESVAGPLIGVCTNGSRDGCCAVFGRPIAHRLTAEFGGGRVTEISHLGGHRFAGTMLVLPWGYSYGFLDPDSAAAIVADAIDGLVNPHGLRGRADLSPAAQAAEINWRRELGSAAPGAVVITGEQAGGDDALVTAAVQGRPESLRMTYRPGPRVGETSCGGKPFATGAWRAKTE